MTPQVGFVDGGSLRGQAVQQKSNEAKVNIIGGDGWASDISVRRGSSWGANPPWGGLANAGLGAGIHGGLKPILRVEVGIRTSGYCRVCQARHGQLKVLACGSVVGWALAHRRVQGGRAKRPLSISPVRDYPDRRRTSGCASAASARRDRCPGRRARPWTARSPGWSEMAMVLPARRRSPPARPRRNPGRWR